MTKKNDRLKKLPRWKRVLRWRVWQVSRHWKLRERVAKANTWANDNPKKFFHWTVGILVGCFVLTVVFTVVSFMTDNSKQQKPLVGKDGQIEDIQPMFDGLHRIEENRKQIKSGVKDMTDKGLEIKKELDSLVNLPVKSHEDSVRIYQDYSQLQNIVNFLKKGRDNEKD